MCQEAPPASAHVDVHPKLASQREDSLGTLMMDLQQ